MDERATDRGAAFGLAIEADFAIPGLRGPAAGAALPSAVLKLGDEAELERAWRTAEGGARRLSEERVRHGEPGRTIDLQPGIGYRLFARYFGSRRSGHSGMARPSGRGAGSASSSVAACRWPPCCGATRSSMRGRSRLTAA